MANERLLVLKIKSPDDKGGRGGAIIASLKIVSMTRDQLLTLRVVGAKGSEKLINKLDLDSLNIRVRDKEEDVKYNITVKSLSAYTLTVRLGFKNIRDLSSTNVSKCVIKPKVQRCPRGQAEVGDQLPKHQDKRALLSSMLHSCDSYDSSANRCW